MYNFGALYKAIDDNIKQNERQYIYHDYISDRYETIEYNVKYNKNDLQAENSNKRTMLRESTAQKLVMEMALIGLKYGLSAAQTRYDDTHHIETWYDEQRVGQKQTIAAEWHHIRVVHNKLNEQERKHETQRETARIAHKNLVFMILSTVDIVIQERNDYTDKTGYKHAVDEHTLALEAIEEACKRKHSESASESVNAIDQVYGVVYEHYNEHRKWRTYIERYRLNAHKTVEVVYVQTRERHKARRQYLYDEFDARRYTHDIVDKTNGVN